MQANDPSKFVYENDIYDPQKHESERVEFGHSEYDFWNFDQYLSFVIIGGLEKFKTGAGYPGEFNDMSEWVAVLDEMIEGFEAHRELQEMTTWNNENYKAWEAPLVAKRDKALQLFIKYFPHLWD